MARGYRRGVRPRKHLRRRGQPPRGPFTGRDAERVLRTYGWTALEAASDEQTAIYVKPADRMHRVPVDPGWKFYEGDAIFNCLQRDLGIGADELTRRLSGHDETA